MRNQFVFGVAAIALGGLSGCGGENEDSVLYQPAPAADTSGVDALIESNVSDVTLAPISGQDEARFFELTNQMSQRLVSDGMPADVTSCAVDMITTGLRSGDLDPVDVQSYVAAGTAAPGALGAMVAELSALTECQPSM